MQGGHDGQRQRDRPAQAQGSDVVIVPYDHPAGSGCESADPQRGADRIDHQQNKDDAEASDRGAQKIGRIKPPATIGQSRQQKRDADPAFRERTYKGERRQRQNDRDVFCGTISGAHRKAIIAPTLPSANHDAWRANSTPTRSEA